MLAYSTVRQTFRKLCKDLPATIGPGTRRPRIHDLRHTFGTQVIGIASILQVKEWMGHADVDTTMQYLHYAPREADAALIAEAFKPASAAESLTLPPIVN